MNKILQNLNYDRIILNEIKLEVQILDYFEELQTSPPFCLANTTFLFIKLIMAVQLRHT